MSNQSGPASSLSVVTFHVGPTPVVMGAEEDDYARLVVSPAVAVQIPTLHVDQHDPRYYDPQRAYELLEPIALACSGGGIRSASFCAGGLFQLSMASNRVPAALSSVSGGGYLSSAYMHWARVHAQLGVPVRRWAPYFAGHFRRSIGMFVPDWRLPEDDRTYPSELHRDQFNNMRDHWGVNLDQHRSILDKETQTKFNRDWRYALASPDYQEEKDYTVEEREKLPAERRYHDRVQRLPWESRCERVLQTVRGLLSFILRFVLMGTLAALVFIPYSFPFALIMDVMFGDELRSPTTESFFWLPAIVLSSIAVGCGLIASLPWSRGASLCCPGTGAWKWAHQVSSCLAALGTGCAFFASVYLGAKALDALEDEPFTEWIMLIAAALYLVLVNSLSSSLPPAFSNYAGILLGAVWYAHVTEWYVWRMNVQPTDVQEVTFYRQGRIDDPFSLSGKEVHYNNIYTNSSLDADIPAADRWLSFNSSFGAKYHNGVGVTFMVVMFTLSACSSVFISAKDTVLHKWYLKSLRRAFYYRVEACGCESEHASRCAFEGRSAASRRLREDVDTFDEVTAYWRTANPRRRAIQHVQTCVHAAYTGAKLLASAASRICLCICCWGKDVPPAEKDAPDSAPGKDAPNSASGSVDPLGQNAPNPSPSSVGSVVSSAPVGRFVSFWRRSLLRRRRQTWLDLRVEDLQHWVSPGVSLAVRLAVPVYTVCTTVNSWIHGGPTAPTFEHLVLQEGAYWRVGDNQCYQEPTPDQPDVSQTTRDVSMGTILNSEEHRAAEQQQKEKQAAGAGAPKLKSNEDEANAPAGEVPAPAAAVGYVLSRRGAAARQMVTASHTVLEECDLFPHRRHSASSVSASASAASASASSSHRQVVDAARVHPPVPSEKEEKAKEEASGASSSSCDLTSWTGDRLKLSDAMAISAAAVSFGMGRFDALTRTVRSDGIQGLFGLSMGRTVWTRDRTAWPMMKRALLPGALQATNGALHLVLAYGVIDVRSNSSQLMFSIVVAILCLLLLQLLVVCFWDADSVASFPQLRAARRFLGLQFLTDADQPPPCHLVLSDGGHSENLAVLPLLRARHRMIVAMDGGADTHQGCQDLLDLLDEAARRWNIHFKPYQPTTPDGCKEVLLDVPANRPSQPDQVDLRAYIKNTWSRRRLRNDDRRTLALAIEVHYPQVPEYTDTTTTGVRRRVEAKAACVGLLIYLKPRQWEAPPPTTPTPTTTGTGLVDRDHYTQTHLHGCCCVCCHTEVCGHLTSGCCDVFPHVSTANQFFTPEQHRWYRLQGMAAMQQAYTIREQWERQYPDVATGSPPAPPQ